MYRCASTERKSRAGFLVVLTILVLGIAILGWSVAIEPRRLVETRLSVTPYRWPADVPIRKIAFLTDFHVGSPGFDIERLDKIVDRVNAWRPDVVLLGGDFVIHGLPGGTFVPPETIAAVLGHLRARDGVIAVLGNHDWWFDGPRVRRALENQGIAVLENEARAAGPLWIAGLADDTTRFVDPAAAFAAIPDDAPVIALMHDPANFPDLPGFAALTLAGHTHCGQIRLPGIGPLIVPGRAPRRHACGMVRESGQTLYVSAGLGTSILPIRLGAPPEIVLIKLGRKRSANF